MSLKEEISKDKENKAEEEKNKGNEAYKKKDFETAINFYTSAIQLNPNNIIYLNNRAASYLELGKYNQCIEDCNKAIELGRQIKADFKHIAK